MLNNSLMRHMPPVMAAMVLSLLLQGVALAFSYDDIVMLVQAEKSQGLRTTSASLDERLAHLEEKVFGSPRVGSESKRLRDLCYKIGLLAPAVERFNSSIPGQAGPVVARKHTQVSSMVSSHQVPLQIALVKRPVQNQPCLVLPGISFTGPAAAQPATLNTTVAVRGTTGDTGACNLQHGTAMESVTGRAITAVPPQSEKTVYSPVKQAPVASPQPKDQSGDTPAVLWIISASAAASGLLIVAVIAMLLHRSTRIRALKSQWTRNVRQTSGGRNSGAHSKEATANTMGKSQNKQSKAAAAPAQRPGLNEQAPADSAPARKDGSRALPGGAGQAFAHTSSRQDNTATLCQTSPNLAGAATCRTNSQRAISTARAYRQRRHVGGLQSGRYGNGICGCSEDVTSPNCRRSTND